MKLILDDGRVFNLIQTDSSSFILQQEEPYKDIPHLVYGEDRGCKYSFRYQSIALNGKMYAFKELK